MKTERAALPSVGKLLLIAAALLAVASSAQTAPPSIFDVAAIKQNKSGSGSSHSDIHDGRFTASNVSLRNLMQYEAYDIPAMRIMGGSKWIDSARFDIKAKMDDSVAAHLETLAHSQRKLETQAMFQQLLADRFKLAVHWETRELPIYALIVAKKGPKLQLAKDRTGTAGTSSHGSRLETQLDATSITLPQLAEALTQLLSPELGRDITDKTGMAGVYDLTLKWSRDSGVASGEGDASAASLEPSIFTALQEQLGLKLESSKGPVQVLVIDHAEMPSEN